MILLLWDFQLFKISCSKVISKSIWNSYKCGKTHTTKPNFILLKTNKYQTKYVTVNSKKAKIYKNGIYNDIWGDFISEEIFKFWHIKIVISQILEFLACKIYFFDLHFKFYMQ